MAALSKARVESFRSLPLALRAELLAKVGKDKRGISAARLQRVVQILDRHLFNGEPSQALHRALHISRQQFHADLREGLRRLHNEIDGKNESAAGIVLDNPRQGIIAQARAMYQCGMSQRAIDLVAQLRAAPLLPGEATEVAGLELEVLEDLMMPFDSLRGAAQVVENARARAESDGASTEDRLLLRGTAHWIQTHLSCYGHDRARFLREYDTMVSLLRPLAFSGNREAAFAFCRFTLASIVMLDAFDWHLDGQRAERGLSDVEALVRLRSDMPPALSALLHARRATFLYGKPAHVRRFREERARAYAMGIERSSTASVWYALALEVTYSRARGENAHALACASSLYDGVQASESAEWRLASRAMLASAYNAVGRYGDVEQLIPLEEARTQPYRPHAILPVCEMLLGRRRYRECAELASLVVDRAKGVHLASALAFRAKAAFCAGDEKRAAGDITDAIAMFDSLRGHSFHSIYFAYRTAHLITHEKRYRDMLRAIDALLDDDPFEAPLVGAERGLTARQREIARLAAAGETSRSIARTLDVSLRIVHASLTAIYARLGIRARWQLAEALERLAST